MIISQIDTTPLCPGWGCVWQGGWIDEPAKFRQIPGPLVIVAMNADRFNEDCKLIDGSHHHVVAVLDAGIRDSADGVLPDAVLLGLVDAGIAILRQGINLYVHCAAGISRSTYYIAALRMRVLGVGAEEALAQIRERRSIVDPVPAFRAHLRRIEPLLRSGRETEP